MRGLKLLVAGLLITGMAMAQSTFVQSMGYNDYSFRSQINIGNISPKATHPSAYLELGLATGSTRGVLLPRGFRGAIVSPAEGLMFYDKTDKDVFFHDGTSWVRAGFKAGTATVRLDSVAIRNDSLFYFTTDSSEHFGGVTVDATKYYTRSQLQTSGQASVAWGNILSPVTLYTANGTLPANRRVNLAGYGLGFYTNATNYDSLNATSATLQRGEGTISVTDGGVVMKNEKADLTYMARQLAYKLNDSVRVALSFSKNNNTYNWKGAEYYANWQERRAGMRTNVNWKRNNVDTSFKGFWVEADENGMGQGHLKADIEVLPKGSGVPVVYDAATESFYRDTATGGSGSGSGTVNSGTTGKLAYYAADGTTVSAASGVTTDGTNLTVVGTTNLGPMATDPVSAPDGAKYYNTTTNRERTKVGGAWQNTTTDNNVGGLLLTGKIIYVDNLNVNATDSRAGLSKYSQTAPFKTVQAAVNASTPSAQEIIYVRAGVYNENAIFDAATNAFSYANVPSLVLDGAVLDGGANSALYYTGNFDPRLYLINGAQIKNTGVLGDAENTAALKTNDARLWIFGNSTKLSSITSVNANAAKLHASSDIFIERVTFHSTKSYAINFINNNQPQNLSYCTIISDSSTAIYAGATIALTDCIVSGADGIDLINQPPDYRITNSTITATSGSTITTSTALGAENLTKTGIAYNSTFVGYNYVFYYLASGLSYKIRFDNCKFILTNASATSAIYPLEPFGHVGGPSTELRATNTVSSHQLFTDWLRTNKPEFIKESNTNIGNTLTFGIMTGFGSANPSAQVDIKSVNGYNQLRTQTPYTPTSSSDTNGNTGQWAWDENYIYIKTSAGWKRSALSTF